MMAAQLKAASAFKVSSGLFWYQDGAPISFYFEQQLEDLENIIHKGGGYLVDDPKDADILLCETKSDNRIKDGYLPLEFIVDCVKKNTFLNIESYRKQNLGLQPSTSRSSSPDSSDVEFVRIATTQPVRTKDLLGRKKYSDLDDIKIIKYLMSMKRYSEIGGNLVWKQMALVKVTDHTFQSMRARFFKQILPNLDSYTMQPEWKEKLRKIRSSTTRSSSKGTDVSNDSFESIARWRRQTKGNEMPSSGWVSSRKDDNPAPSTARHSLFFETQSPYFSRKGAAKKYSKDKSTSLGNDLSPLAVPGKTRDPSPTNRDQLRQLRDLYERIGETLDQQHADGENLDSQYDDIDYCILSAAGQNEQQAERTPETKYQARQHGTTIEIPAEEMSSSPIYNAALLQMISHADHEATYSKPSSEINEPCNFSVQPCRNGEQTLDISRKNNSFSQIVSAEVQCPDDKLHSSRTSSVANSDKLPSSSHQMAYHRTLDCGEQSSSLQNNDCGKMRAAQPGKNLRALSRRTNYFESPGSDSDVVSEGGLPQKSATSSVVTSDKRSSSSRQMASHRTLDYGEQSSSLQNNDRGKMRAAQPGKNLRALSRRTNYFESADSDSDVVVSEDGSPQKSSKRTSSSKRSDKSTKRVSSTQRSDRTEQLSLSKKHDNNAKWKSSSKRPDRSDRRTSSSNRSDSEQAAGGNSSVECRNQAVDHGGTNIKFCSSESTLRRVKFLSEEYGMTLEDAAHLLFINGGCFLSTLSYLESGEATIL